MFALPVVLLLFSVPIWSMVHMLPVWVYTAWCLERRRLSLSYEDFRHTFLWGARLQLAWLPGLILSSYGKEAALASLPYLLVLLAVGICNLRCLRQPGATIRTGLWTAAFMSICLLLTLGGIPDLILKGLGWFYKNVVVWIFQAAASVLLMFITWIVKVIADLSRLEPADKQQIVDMESGTLQDMLGTPGTPAGAEGVIRWVAVIGYIAVGAAVIALLVWLVVRLLGSLDGGKTVTVVYSQRVEPERTVQRPGKPVKPKDPRGRVRYYYALFLRECKNRGMEVLPGSTESELTGQCIRYFPGADPRDLALLYRPARYWVSQPVSAQQAEDAARAWKRLKKTKYKKVDT